MCDFAVTELLHAHRDCYRLPAAHRAAQVRDSRQSTLGQSISASQTVPVYLPVRYVTLT